MITQLPYRICRLKPLVVVVAAAVVVAVAAVEVAVAVETQEQVPRSPVVLNWSGFSKTLSYVARTCADCGLRVCTLAFQTHPAQKTWAYICAASPATTTSILESTIA